MTRLRVARQLNRLRNRAGIVSCRDFFRANATVYLVMDFEASEPLPALLSSYEAQGHPFGEAGPLQVMVPLLYGRAKMHAAKVVHRQVKPSNILVRGADGQPVLIDFGTAKQDHLEQRKSFAPFTDGFAAFEQIDATAKLGH